MGVFPPTLLLAHLDQTIAGNVMQKYWYCLVRKTSHPFGVHAFLCGRGDEQSKLIQSTDYWGTPPFCIVWRYSNVHGWSRACLHYTVLSQHVSCIPEWNSLWTFVISSSSFWTHWEVHSRSHTHPIPPTKKGMHTHFHMHVRAHMYAHRHVYDAHKHQLLTPTSHPSLLHP